MKNLFRFAIVLMAVFIMGACTNALIEVSPNNPDPNPPMPPDPEAMTTAETFADASVNQGAFNLPGKFPADIQIPDVDGARNTAFVVNFSPQLVIPVNLDVNPLEESANFPIFDASAIPELVFPGNLLFLSSTQAFLLGTNFTGSGVAYFNPTSGEVLQVLSLNDPIDLTQTLPYSRPQDCDFDTVTVSSVGPGPFVPTFLANAAVANGRLFLVMSNGCFDFTGSAYTQSMVLIFDINDSMPFLTPASTPHIILNGFNATAVTAVGDKLIVGTTGDTAFDFSTNSSTPETPSFLTEVDPETLQVTRTLNLGMVGINFRPLAVTSDESAAFIGSSTFSEVYEIDLDSFTVVRGQNNPIEIFDVEADYISDQELAFGDQVLFVSSYNQSGVKGIDLSSSERNVLPEILDFAFEVNPGVTGAGPIAVRPGRPTIDYTGPDLFVLTGDPGTISTATTY